MRFVIGVLKFLLGLFVVLVVLPLAVILYKTHQRDTARDAREAARLEACDWRPELVASLNGRLFHVAAESGASIGRMRSQGIWSQKAQRAMPKGLYCLSPEDGEIVEVSSIRFFFDAAQRLAGRLDLPDIANPRRIDFRRPGLGLSRMMHEFRFQDQGQPDGDSLVLVKQDGAGQHLASRGEVEGFRFGLWCSSRWRETERCLLWVDDQSLGIGYSFNALGLEDSALEGTSVTPEMLQVAREMRRAVELLAPAQSE